MHRMGNPLRLGWIIWMCTNAEYRMYTTVLWITFSQAILINTSYLKPGDRYVLEAYLGLWGKSARSLWAVFYVSTFSDFPVIFPPWNIYVHKSVVCICYWVSAQNEKSFEAWMDRLNVHQCRVPNVYDWFEVFFCQASLDSPSCLQTGWSIIPEAYLGLESTYNYKPVVCICCWVSALNVKFLEAWMDHLNVHRCKVPDAYDWILDIFSLLLLGSPSCLVTRW